MKKRNFISLLLSVIFIAVSTSSCKSMETKLAEQPSGIETIDIPAITIANGNFGGTVYQTAAATAATAAPIPDQPGFTHTTSVSETDEPDGSADSTDTEETDSAEDTTAPAPVTATTAATSAKPRESSPDMVISDVVVTTPAATTTTTAATTTTASETTTVVSPATTVVTLSPPSPASSSGSYTANSYTSLNYSYVKAVWISYLELNALYGKNEADFTSLFGKMLDNCQSIGINTVYVHVRAFGDAYYYSDLFPFTKQLSGTLGKRTDYDPLKIMVSEAHKRKISFHAWINPLRLCTADNMPSVSEDYLTGKWYHGSENGTYIVKVNGIWYLNPAYEAVRKLIGDNVREIVSNYDVDGIHIDDYFYPTTDVSFDSSAYAASGYPSIDSFRVDRCSAMVKEMYTAAHECGTAIFGAAPQGNNYNNLYSLYADTKAWCKGGYIDYFTPQIYYGFENSAVPFKDNVNEWLSIVSGTKTKLYIGLAVYKAGNEDKWAGSGKYEWQNTSTMLKRQKEYADSVGCNGISLFSYNYLFDPSYNTQAVRSEVENLKPLMTQ